MGKGRLLLTSTYLKRTRKLIEDKGSWCKEYYAIDEYGRNVPLTSEQACSWCLSGALQRVVFSDSGSLGSRYNAARAYLNEKTNWVGIGVYNDNHSHNDILEVLDRAIAAAKADEKLAKAMSK